jgi:Phytanoyl-CoA dioxygenase (PhyH)
VRRPGCCPPVLIVAVWMSWPTRAAWSTTGRYRRSSRNQIPYLPALRHLVRRVLGPGAFSYPAKVLRAVYPERPEARPRGRYVHYDYGVSGVQDMLTSWVPLMGIPPRIGGLAIRPGGHLGPPWRPRPLSRSEPGWATTSYKPGDVIIFHCLAPHAALPNQGSVLRISGDFRWQRPDQPAPAELIAGSNLAAASGRSHGDVRPRVVVGAGPGRAGPVPPGRAGPPPARALAADQGGSGLAAWRPPSAVVH